MSASTNSIGEEVHRRVSEFFDGYVLVGFVAGDDNPVIVTPSMDIKTALAINNLLQAAQQKLHIHTTNPDETGNTH